MIYESIANYINRVTTQTRTLEMARHGIGIHTRYWYRCSSEVSVSEVSVQSGISLSLFEMRPLNGYHQHPIHIKQVV